MDDVKTSQRRAVLAGALGLAAAAAVGLPYALVVVRDNAATSFNAQDRAYLTDTAAGRAFVALAKLVPGTERAWRMAHLEALTNAFLALLIAALTPLAAGGGRLAPSETLALGDSAATLVASNVAGSVVAAVAGVRGLTLGGSAPNVLATMCFLPGVYALPRAAYLLARGVW